MIGDTDTLSSRMSNETAGSPDAIYPAVVAELKALIAWDHPPTLPVTRTMDERTIVLVVQERTIVLVVQERTIVLVVQERTIVVPGPRWFGRQKSCEATVRDSLGGSGNAQSEGAGGR